MVLGWGVYGLGTHVSRFFAPALNLAKDTRFVAVCSRSIIKAKEFAAGHKVERSYDSYEKMLADPDIDVVYIATPNHLHAQHVKQAAEAGKHILCEKPMALTVSESESMIEACLKHKVKLGIDFEMRYHPAHVEARRLVRENNIGPIYFTRAQYCHGFTRGHWNGWRNDAGAAGAGALVGTALHPLDLLRFVLDSEVTQVSAMCLTQTEYHNVDEMVYATLKFKNGIVGSVISGILAPRSDNDIVIYGENLKIIGKDTVGMPLKGELIIEGNASTNHIKFPNDYLEQGTFIKTIEAFNRCIETNTASEISGENGLQMVKLTLAVLESNITGQVINIK